MKYHKLVRDKIPELLKRRGKTSVTHIADKQEYVKKLGEKLREEVDEYFEGGREEELADILEVLDAIYEAKQIDRKLLERLRRKKRLVRGGFKKRIILEEAT